MYSAIVGGVVLVIVFIILAMAMRCLTPDLGPRYVLALATLVTAISGLVAALAYLM